MKNEELDLYHKQIAERYEENKNGVDISCIPIVLDKL
jgi:hypothetical protein